MSEPKKRKTHKITMRRSDIIRSALLWYLRPQGRDLDQADPAAVLEVLQRRKTRADLKKMMEDME